MANYRFDTNKEENAALNRLSRETYNKIISDRVKESQNLEWAGLAYNASSPSDLYKILDAEYNRSSIWSSDIIQSNLERQQLADLIKFMKSYKNGSLQEYNRALDDYFNQQQNSQADLKKQANDLISNALLLVDQELSSVQEGYLRQRLMEHLLMDDGSIDTSLLNNFGTYLLDSLSWIVDDVVNNQSAYYRNRGLLDEMINSLFGDDT